MESQNIYLDHSSYHSGQDSDYIYDSQDHYSNTGDSDESSLIDDSELSDIDWWARENVYKSFIYNIYTKYMRYFNDGNTLEAEVELPDMRYNVRKSMITPITI